MLKLSQEKKARAVARVYDIINCGPNNRFVANGKLVHNSGGNKVNAQNFVARGPSAGIRKAIIAPPGHLVVVGDSSNIELRVAMACAGQTDAVEKLRAGVDLYCDFASRIFGFEVTKEDKDERFLGKVAMLSLQYGAGGTKFREIVRLLAKQDISKQRAFDIVELYRNVHSKVRDLWSRCDNVVLPAINNGRFDVQVDVNGWFYTIGEGFSHPPLPGVKYPELSKDQLTGEWSYQTSKGRVNIYGGKIVENLCQHMARHVVMWQTAAINEVYPVSLSVHDEVVCVVPEKEVEACVKYMTAVLSTAPAWCRAELPVACEVGYGRSYGDAK
jgi:DNA polymerase